MTFTLEFSLPFSISPPCTMQPNVEHRIWWKRELKWLQIENGLGTCLSAAISAEYLVCAQCGGTGYIRMFSIKYNLCAVEWPKYQMAKIIESPLTYRTPPPAPRERRKETKEKYFAVRTPKTPKRCENFCYLFSVFSVWYGSWHSGNALSANVHTSGKRAHTLQRPHKYTYNISRHDGI